MKEEQLDEIIQEARAWITFDVERAGYGLETRVVSRVQAENETNELLARWVWRGAFGVAPVVALMVAWLCVWSGFSAETFLNYDAAGDFTVYLPLNLY